MSEANEPQPKKPPAERGLKCPVCWCRDFWVTNVYREDGSILRRRVCRHCGRVLKTVEKPYKPKTGQEAA